MLIHNVTERKKASANKMLNLLTFLKEETYSDFRTIRNALGYSENSHSPVYRLLNRAVDEGFVLKHEVPGIRQKITLWGITMQGLAMVVMPDDATFPGYFEPGKLKYWALEHHLMNQRIRLALEAKGGEGWINGDRGEFQVRFSGVNHRPDGVIRMKSGAIIAVEAERTMKTRARYISIINSHLAAFDAGHWHYAMYVTPDERTRDALIRLFASIKTVMRRSVPVSFEKNREMFQFRSVQELERQAKPK